MNISLETCLKRLDISTLEKANNEAKDFSLNQQKASTQNQASLKSPNGISHKLLSVQNSTSQNTANGIPDQLLLRVGQTFKWDLKGEEMFGEGVVSLSVSNTPSWMTVTAPVLGTLDDQIKLSQCQIIGNLAFGIVNGYNMRILDIDNPVSPNILSNMTDLAGNVKQVKMIDSRWSEIDLFKKNANCIV